MTPLIDLSAAGLLAAFAAGLLSFLSPCVLPLIPVYLSFISGESVADLRSVKERRMPLLVRTLFFVAGFASVFVMLALAFGGGMRFIGSSARESVNRIAGIAVIILALNVILDFIPFLRMEIRAHPAGTRISGNLKAVFLGMAFAAGWTPCVGPILSSILLYAGQNGSSASAAILLAAYASGLGLPFIMTGLFLDKTIPVLSFFKRHATAIRIASGLLLFAFGLAILSNGLSGIPTFFLKAGYRLEEIAAGSPAWFRPIASFLSRWLLF